MIAVIFEVEPQASHHYYQAYLDWAEKLAPSLRQIDGFVSIERFQSLSKPGKILSLSFWRDEDAVKAWRNTELHRGAQARGRGDIFADYRLTVAAVIRDYGMNERDEAPADSRAVHA